MKSETLSQFQSTLQELNGLSTFGRGKDRMKRKSKGMSPGQKKALGTAGVVAGAGGLGAGGVVMSKLGKATTNAGGNITGKALKGGGFAAKLAAGGLLAAGAAKAIRNKQQKNKKSLFKK